MAQLNGHWTNESVKAFLYRISFDFVTQLENMMDADGVKPNELAKRLGVSKGRVSQILNNPGNLTLRTVVEYARALDVKVAIVAYDDDDVDNDNGPVNPQIFAACWERSGKPTDFFSAGMAVAVTGGVEIDARWSRRDVPAGKLDPEMAATMAQIDSMVWQSVEDRGENAGTDSD